MLGDELEATDPPLELEQQFDGNGGRRQGEQEAHELDELDSCLGDDGNGQRADGGQHHEDGEDRERHAAGAHRFG